MSGRRNTAVGISPIERDLNSAVSRNWQRDRRLRRIKQLIAKAGRTRFVELGIEQAQVGHLLVKLFHRTVHGWRLSALSSNTITEVSTFAFS